jgi:uncharacterized protein
MNASEDQIGPHALTDSELVSALKLIFDEWIASERATTVEPIEDYISFAIANLAGRRNVLYRKEQDESVFVVNLDGGIWGTGDQYEPDYRYGDLSQQSFGDVLTSKTRRLMIEEAEIRLERHCRKCPYHGACPGHYVADASPQQKALLERSGCPVRKVLDHIVATLECTGMADVLAKQAGKKNDSALTIAGI